VLLRRSQLDLKVADREPGQLLDIAQIAAFLLAAQRDRCAGRTGARGSADAVNIVFGHVRQLEIDDVRYAFHIDPSRGNVGSDEDPAAAGAKAGECALALRLRLVSVDGDRLDTSCAQMSHDPVRTVLRASEHEHPFEGRIAQQCRQSVPFPIARNEKDALIDQLDRRRGRRDGHLDRVVEVLLGQGGDRPRHRRREQQCLTVSWQQFHYAPQGMDEPEVEHSIRLVEDQNLDLRQSKRFAVDQVKQAPWRRHQDVGPRREPPLLGANRDAAEHDRSG